MIPVAFDASHKRLVEPLSVRRKLLEMIANRFNILPMRMFVPLVATLAIACPRVGYRASAGGSDRSGRSGSMDGAPAHSSGEMTDAGTTGGRSCPLRPEGEQVISLAGTWTFTPAGAPPTTIQVPGGGWVAQGFPNVSSARYARSVMIPALGSPQATLVEFGAANHRATLSIDGSAVGTNMTSYTPSVFDITGAAAPNTKHMLIVDVEGRGQFRAGNGKKLVPDGTNWSPNIPQGIFRSALLHVMPGLHVSDAFVRTDVIGDTVRVDVSITNSGTAIAMGTVSAAISSFNCEAFSYPTLPNQLVTVRPGQTATVTLGPVRWGLGSSSYWWPNIPYAPGYRARLHYASVTVRNAAGIAHTTPFRFGFRQSRQVGNHYELNGIRVNFRGDNIQGIDYDSIDNTGKGLGDAYDLYPGFLPPSAGNPGWPRAVENWQRLNYNVVRIHQEPATPYMLDVADEMGLMIIDETAIRGSAGDEDFTPGPAGGEPNMVAHLRALMLRDRNHPSIIRWSQCNEPENDNTNSATFQLHLYQTAMAVDDTRPVSSDGQSGDRSYAGIIANSNFAVIDHYTNGFSAYTDNVCSNMTKPCGVGEFVWPADYTAEGLIWFGTSTMAMRLKNAADLRPYTLLSGWASFVPGVTSTMMTLEPTYPAGIINHPHFGEENLPDPWTNSIINRLQRAFSPVAVIDTDYWLANHLSNIKGDWPAAPQTAAHGASLVRQLAVFNDTLANTGVEIGWEMHVDASTGPIADQGTLEVTVPLGEHITVPITVQAPATGTRAYLVLMSSKGGIQTFRDDAEYFEIQ